MDIRTLEKLLAQEEGDQLDFKERLDLDDKEGKVKFLRAMLALANSAEDYSYLIVGVEDKTKRLLGVRDLTEERIQQLMADYCKPPIPFSFELVPHKGVRLGVIRIRHSGWKPHTLKTKLGFIDSSSKKQQEFLDTQVFLR